MTDSDGDIEYLDEDADIVQHCVQTVQQIPIEDQLLTPLLVERPQFQEKDTRKKLKRKHQDDSDYDPNEDYAPPSPPPSPKAKKKKTNVVKKQNKVQKVAPANLNVVNKNIVKPVVLDRKTANIQIPDYDDPLCLPVKALRADETDRKRLKNWNYVCLEHFKHCDALLKPEKGETRTSTRIMVFKNVMNKVSGKIESTIWTKTSVENEDGDRKSEIFQSVLPRYREKKVLNYKTNNPNSFGTKRYHLRNEVILCKEQDKGEDILVAYKPKESMASVYNLVNCSNTERKDEDSENVKRYMKEQTCCKVCASCFQASWRGVRNTTERAIECPLCGRTSVTIYNLLAHFRNHSASELKPVKHVISAILAEIVEYHYRCRICRQQCSSIGKLRKHMKSHQGQREFTCEICNHLTT